MFTITNEDTVDILARLSTEVLEKNVSRRCLLAAAELAHTLTHLTLKFGIGQWLHFSQEYLRKLMLERHCVEYISGTILPFLQEIGFLSVDDAHNNNAYKYLVNINKAKEIKIAWLEGKVAHVAVQEPEKAPFPMESGRFPITLEPLKGSTTRIKEKKINKKKKKKIAETSSSNKAGLDPSSLNNSTDEESESSALVLLDNTDETMELECAGNAATNSTSAQLLTDEELRLPWFRENGDGEICHEGFVEYLSQQWFHSNYGRSNYTSVFQAQAHVESWLGSPKTSVRVVFPQWKAYRLTSDKGGREMATQAAARGYFTKYEVDYFRRHYDGLPDFIPPRLIESQAHQFLLEGVGEMVPVGEISDNDPCWVFAEAKATEVEAGGFPPSSDRPPKATEELPEAKATEVAKIDVIGLIKETLFGGQPEAQEGNLSGFGSDESSCDRMQKRQKRPDYTTIARLKESHQWLKSAIRDELLASAIHPAEIPTLVEQRFNDEINQIYQSRLKEQPMTEQRLNSGVDKTRKKIAEARQRATGRKILSEEELSVNTALGNIRFWVLQGDREKVAQLINESKIVVDIDWDKRTANLAEF